MTDTSTPVRAGIHMRAAVPTFLVPDVARTAIRMAMFWYSVGRSLCS